MDKNVYLGFSTQLNSTILEDVDFALKNKFNALCLELSWNPELEFSNEEINALNDFSSKGNKLIIHLPFFLTTNSSIPEIFNGVLNYFKKVIILAKKVNSTVLTLHGGYNEQIGDFKTQKYLIKNLKKLVALSNKAGIELSIENDDKDSDYPVWELDVVSEILSKVKGLTFTYDIGHSNTAGYDSLKFYDSVKDYINIIHLHNNFGKDSHNSLDDGNIPFKEILPKIMESNVDLIYILELYPYKKILQSRKFFQKIIMSL